MRDFQHFSSRFIFRIAYRYPDRLLFSAYKLKELSELHINDWKLESELEVIENRRINAERNVQKVRKTVQRVPNTVMTTSQMAVEWIQQGEFTWIIRLSPVIFQHFVENRLKWIFIWIFVFEFSVERLDAKPLAERCTGCQALSIFRERESAFRGSHLDFKRMNDNECSRKSGEKTKQFARQVPPVEQRLIVCWAMDAKCVCMASLQRLKRRFQPRQRELTIKMQSYHSMQLAVIKKVKIFTEKSSRTKGAL